MSARDVTSVCCVTRAVRFLILRFVRRSGYGADEDEDAARLMSRLKTSSSRVCKVFKTGDIGWLLCAWTVRAFHPSQQAGWGPRYSLECPIHDAIRLRHEWGTRRMSWFMCVAPDVWVDLCVWHPMCGLVCVCATRHDCEWLGLQCRTNAVACLG